MNRDFPSYCKATRPAPMRKEEENREKKEEKRERRTSYPNFRTKIDTNAGDPLFRKVCDETRPLATSSRVISKL